MSEMRKADLYQVDPTDLTWRTSSYSKDGKDCVEVAELPGGAVALRDSKNPRLTPLRFTAGEWTAFVEGVRDGEF
ncbi:DUF397 domain-containing protein [Kitasatospora viridis]|uniref:Uncharacterized protein DUF397 n=1 Tax=Kitasatospora viridis TaxID=281105 RepID=A0A561UNA2_9ACTN|nr:DUF397 domain-containing protein [Kitasatospora viridis]TWG00843.1 uncharacterized protein DUF397 [Kitasatospora viridis]